MIVKISAAGKSFKGLCDYLTHDPNKAKTAERVAWTHTLNLCHDEVPGAVHEMYMTADNAELLKMESGVRAGGRVTESPVRHASLNWAPGETPTPEHMIKTSEQFLKHMGWHEHQAILIAHDDKAYRHVHIMLNAVHSETGLCLSQSFEKRRAQVWALDYERAHGIHCAERLKPAHEREKHMPRNAWMAFSAQEKTFERSETLLSDKSPHENTPDEKSPHTVSPNLRKYPDNLKNAEWKILKQFQCDERLAFFAERKNGVQGTPYHDLPRGEGGIPRTLGGLLSGA